jgi:ribosomal protein S27AE
MQDQNDKRITAPSTMAMLRHSDETGVSGTGHVADVVRFLDGRCVVHWHVDGVRSTTVHHDDLDSVMGLHGHDGRTTLMLMPTSKSMMSDYERGWLLAQTARLDNWPVVHFRKCTTMPGDIEGGTENREAEQGWYDFLKAMHVQVDRSPMTANTPREHCPNCGAREVMALTPRTTYGCGSSDYDQRPGTFRKGDDCNNTAS